MRWYDTSRFVVLILALLAGRSLLAGEEGREAPLDKAEQAILKSILSAEERAARAHNHVLRGKEKFSLRLYQDAKEAFEAALRIDPDNEAAREGLANANQYLAARSDKLAARIPREVDRVRINDQHAQMYAQNHIQKAEDLILQATSDKPGGEGFEEQAKSLERRIRYLTEADDSLRRARLALNSLPARMNPEADLNRVKVMISRVQTLSKEYEQLLNGANRSLALERERQNKSDIEQVKSEQRLKLIASARLHMGLKEYNQAEKVLNTIIRENPADKEVEDMIEELRRKRRTYRAETLTDLAKETRKRVLERIARWAVPDVSPEQRMRFPEHWDDLIKQKEVRRAEAQSLDPESRRVLQKLQDRFTVEFDTQAAADVIAHLRMISGVNIVYNPGDAEPPAVTLNVRDMRLDNILSWITTITGLNYEVKEGVVYVASAEGLTEAMVTEVYDVRDLYVAVSDSRAMPRGFGEEDDDDDEEAGELETASLEEIIKNVLLADFGDGGEGEVSLDETGNLTVLHTREVQQKVLDLLAKLRAAQAIQVAVSARFMTVVDDFWEEFDSKFGRFTHGGNSPAAFNNYHTGTGKIRNPGDANYNPSKHFDSLRGLINNNPINSVLTVLGGGAPNANAGLAGQIRQVGWLGQLQMDWFLKAVKESGKADTLFAPHLVVYNNRYGWFRNQTDYPYTHTYQLAPAGESLEPVIEELRLGTSLEVRPTVSADKKYITIDLYPRQVDLLQRPPEQTVLQSASGQFLPIDLPETFEVRTRTYATLPDGGSILLSGLSTNVHNQGRNGVPLMQDIPYIGDLFSRRAYQKEKRNYVIMVHARMILIDEEEAKQTR